MRLRSGAPQVPAGPLGREPRGLRAAKRKRNRERGPEGGAHAGPEQSCPRAPGPCVESAAAPGRSGLPRGGENVAAGAGARTTRARPLPWVASEGRGECIKEEFVHGGLLVT